MTEFTINIAPNVNTNFNFDKFKVEKMVDGNKITKIWKQLPDRCELSSYGLSNDNANFKVNFAEASVNHKGKTFVPISGDTGRIRRGVNVIQSVNTTVPEAQINEILRMPVKKQDKVFFGGKFPRTINIFNEKGSRKIFESLGSREVFVNEKEFIHYRKMIKGGSIIDKAKFPGFNFNYGQLNVDASFDFAKLSKKSQEAVKSILKTTFKNIK